MPVITNLNQLKAVVFDVDSYELVATSLEAFNIQPIFRVNTHQVYAELCDDKKLLRAIGELIPGFTRQGVKNFCFPLCRGPLDTIYVLLGADSCNPMYDTNIR